MKVKMILVTALTMGPILVGENLKAQNRQDEAGLEGEGCQALMDNNGPELNSRATTVFLEESGLLARDLEASDKRYKSESSLPAEWHTSINGDCSHHNTVEENRDSDGRLYKRTTETWIQAACGGCQLSQYRVEMPHPCNDSMFTALLNTFSYIEVTTGGVCFPMKQRVSTQFGKVPYRIDNVTSCGQASTLCRYVDVPMSRLDDQLYGDCSQTVDVAKLNRDDQWFIERYFGANVKKIPVLKAMSHYELSDNVSINRDGTATGSVNDYNIAHLIPGGNPNIPSQNAGTYWQRENFQCSGRAVRSPRPDPMPPLEYPATVVTTRIR